MTRRRLEEERRYPNALHPEKRSENPSWVEAPFFEEIQTTEKDTKVENQGGKIFSFTVESEVALLNSLTGEELYRGRKLSLGREIRVLEKVVFRTFVELSILDDGFADLLVYISTLAQNFLLKLPF